MHLKAEAVIPPPAFMVKAAYNTLHKGVSYDVAILPCANNCKLLTSGNAKAPKNLSTHQLLHLKNQSFVNLNLKDVGSTFVK
jgi:hypothetical protein